MKLEGVNNLPPCPITLSVALRSVLSDLVPGYTKWRWGNAIDNTNIGPTYNYLPPPAEITEKARRIEAVCTRHGVPLRIAAANFPLGHPAITALLIGGDTPNQFAETVAALRTPIPAALWADLRAEGLLRADAPVPE